LIIVIISVFVMFLLATVVAQVRQAAVDRRVEDILDNSMPSVQSLSAARSALGRLRLDASDFARSNGHKPTRSAWRADRRWLDSELNRYLTLPFDPGERELQPQLSDDLSQVDLLISQIEERIDAGADPTPIVPRLGAAVDRTDSDIERLVQLNAQVGLLQARQIDRLRLLAVRSAVLIDGATVVLVVIAVMLAVRTLRRTVRFIDERRVSAELRAEELAVRADELGQFGGRLAHDVLSPLATAGLALEQARRRSGDPHLRVMMTRGISSLERTRRIVDGLLDFARSGAPPEGSARASVPAVVRDVVDGARVEADAAQIEIVVEPLCEHTVACSPGVLTSLVSNLVRNAVKYIGDAPTRRIRVRGVSVDGRCRVEVEDTGPGIPPELCESLFRPYVRARPDVGTGLGLGLATVKRLAEAHGGTVGVSSRLGVGSLFWFELPLAR
jgi:signal transduction histidine kinase